MPELEKAYLSDHCRCSCEHDDAIAGSASAQRLVAEYIPRYASYCPTALEAAAKVVINMHNCCFSVISRGEDIDGIAFETAKGCILGLVDICQAAASEAPTSSVIQGICSARVLKIYEVSESLLDFKREFLEEDNTVLLKLSKFRALSFLRIFFSCPKNSLVAGFELFESTGMEGIQKGSYFLRQLTIELNDVGAHHLDEGCDNGPSIGSSRTICDEKHPSDDRPASKRNSFSNSTSAVLKNCLLGLFDFSRYRMLCDSASSEVVSDITSVLEGVFESFIQQVKAEGSQVDSFDGNSGSSRARTPREFSNRQSFSPRARTPRDFRSNSFNGRNHSAQIERSPIRNIEHPLPALRPSTGAVNSPFDSPKQNIPTPPSSTNHAVWFSDGDPAAMDIYTASKQLRFLDAGLGTRGAINGTAVGSSCHVYIGNVSSIWAKDEVMHEVKKVLHKGPRMVFDLGSEGALLLEFDSPEEATIMIAHLRWYRKENSNFFLSPSNMGPANVTMHADGSRPASASVHVDTRNNFPANNMIGSPHAQTVLEKPPQSYATRTSGLSSLLLQLRAKYNITHPKGSFENHTPGSSLREQERLPTNTLWITIPNKSISCITDDDVLAVCNLAINNTGSIVTLA
ncbi:hypothetical protein DH2020_003996 [Rehmannia glutinosa]|uniref:RRM domain-containing protein n=1 Tax=Rehmannia glutinosa TaxID=99300 RepID=A0ABR0XN88_REHGL